MTPENKERFRLMLTEKVSITTFSINPYLKVGKENPISSAS